MQCGTTFVCIIQCHATADSGMIFVIGRTLILQLIADWVKHEAPFTMQAATQNRQLQYTISGQWYYPSVSPSFPLSSPGNEVTHNYKTSFMLYRLRSLLI